MVKTKIGYSSSGEPLLPRLTTDRVPRRQKMDRIENEAIEARFQQLESSIETICELLRELKLRKEEKKSESEPDTPKRDEREPSTSKTPF